MSMLEGTVIFFLLSTRIVMSCMLSCISQSESAAKSLMYGESVLATPFPPVASFLYDY